VGQVIAVVFTFVIARGVLRLRAKSQPSCYLSVLGLYVLVLLFWIYLNYQRFLILFLSLFVGGLFVEAKYLVQNVKRSFSQMAAPSRKLVAIAQGGLITVFASLVLADFYRGVRKEVIDLSKNRGALLTEKRQAYHWLAASTDENARLLANDDGALYLYTGRPAVRPSPPISARQYGSSFGNLPPLFVGVAKAIDADYWLISDDDPDWAKPTREADLTESRVEPIVFRSSAGHVWIYYLGCLQHPELRSCPPANGVNLTISQEKQRPEAVVSRSEAQK